VDWMLRSFVNPQARTATHQIYVDWFFQAHGTTKYFAADDTARALPVHQILKESCGRNCGQTDTITIAIDEATLRARAASGFQAKLSTNNGAHVILNITPQMITAQLQAENRIYSAPAGISPVAAAAAANARTPDSKGFLGIAPFDLPFGLGVQVNRVDPNTPASAAGFQIGDSVLSYNGQKVTGADQLSSLIRETAPGTLVPIEINRHEKRMTLNAQM
jgi:membrane-associated protease RseP (regulator of RpoE activity)